LKAPALSWPAAEGGARRIFNFAIGETLLDIPAARPNDSLSRGVSGIAARKGLVLKGMTFGVETTIVAARRARPAAAVAHLGHNPRVLGA
jgi:hypothetical protein